MYRSRNITKNSKNNSHVHNTLGWDTICKYDLRKLSMRLSRHILYCTKRSVCVCTLRGCHTVTSLVQELWRVLESYNSPKIPRVGCVF